MSARPDGDPGRVCLRPAPPPESHARERKVRLVVIITLVMMLAELLVGSLSHSLALIADGWHMGCHAGALGLSALAYWFARTRARHSTFTFGTGKVQALAGYTNAIALLLVAVATIGEAVARLFAPEPIALGEALPVAVIGLVVNLVCAAVLHEEEEEHDHGPGHHDHNLEAAYLHVLGDALVSVGAIAALVGIRYLRLPRLDPIMALVSSLVIVRWAIRLCRTSARPLLDVLSSSELADAIRGKLESLDGARVVDLHLWELAPGRHGCIVSVVTAAPRPVAWYHEAVREVAAVEHLTVEVSRG